MSIIRDRIKVIIFGTDTWGGKLFDVTLIFTIILSIFLVLMDSVAEYHQKYGGIFYVLELIITFFFTIEYLFRIYCIRRAASYVFSFYGIIDFLALIPTYISLIFPGAEVLSVIRVLRVLRVFRVLKLVQFMGEADLLVQALVASRRKIFIFLFTVLNVVLILGSVMYLIEGEAAGFTSIPRSIYWAIVTLTTVGYGDISPMTNLGQSIAAFIMIIGYSIIAIPTGIVTSEINFISKETDKIKCIVCEDKNQQNGSKFCTNCGSDLTNQK